MGKPAKRKSWKKLSLKKPSNCYNRCFQLAALVVVILTITILLLKCYNHFSGSSFPARKNVSFILRELTDSANDLQTVEFQYKKLLHVDPFANLVEQQVMPAHDKMSSIKRQVKIYEDMERTLPPSNFMESSFVDLNFIGSELHRFENQYSQILAVTKKELHSLRYDAKKAYEKLAKVIDDETHEVLKESGIYFDDPSPGLTADPSIEFDDVIERISKAADLFAKWESPRAELKQLVEAKNITTVQQTYGTSILSLLESITSSRKAIDLFLELNGPYIRLTFMFLERQLEECRSDEANVVTVQNRFKKRYDRLTEMLSDDVLSTHERVKKLGFLSKRTTEL